MFEFVIFDSVIIRVMFGLANVVEYLYIDVTQHDMPTRIATPTCKDKNIEIYCISVVGDTKLTTDYRFSKRIGNIG